jgi:F-type H+-transporting ATPase subunit epsilon
MDNFLVTILTPEHTKLEVAVYMALLPLYEGEIGIMAGHVNYNSLIVPGLLKFLSNDTDITHRMFISGGVVEVLDGKLTILADKIIDLQDLSPEEVDIKVAELKTQVAPLK